MYSCKTRLVDEELFRLLTALGNQLGQFLKRNKAEQALQESQEQLRQSQKLEAIGQLAAGVAHDFNNMLAVIMMSTDFLTEKFALEKPLPALLSIQKAANRAAILTRQLLTFCRKQVLAPKVLNLNDVIWETEGMLRRLITEDIELIITLEQHLKHTRLDPTQFTQVIMNLTVNARDALSKGGKIVIATRNVDFNHDEASKNQKLKPGSYIEVTVSDSGCGISKELTTRIFEPFFTTKEEGRGTGLGLATVLGIVKQSGGEIFVESDVGKGARFRMYFPEYIGDVGKVSMETEKAEISRLRGSETVLVVEDEADLREITVELLRANGYVVLEAHDGNEALRIYQEKMGIGLIVADVFMPDLNGLDLVNKLSPLLKERNTRVLFLSGYEAGEMATSDILDGHFYLNKPYTTDILLMKVRQALS